MAILHARHPVPVIRKGPRARFPAISYVDAVTPVEIPHAADGILGPLPEGFAGERRYGEGRYHLVDVHSGRLMRLGPGGLWSKLWVRSETAQPDCRSDPVRPATMPEATAMIEGTAGGDPREGNLLRVTPLRTMRPREAEDRAGAEPDPAMLADVRARLARHVSSGFLIHEEAVLIRFGVPALYYNHGVEGGHPAGFWLSSRHMISDIAQAAMFCVPMRHPDRFAALMARNNRSVRVSDERLLSSIPSKTREVFPDTGTCLAPVAHFVNLAALLVFETATRASSRRPSAEAAGLRERLDASVVALAPWAALGNLGLVERHEWNAVVDLLMDTTRLLLRCYPWSKDAALLDRIVAYAEIVAIPEIAEPCPDEEALSAFGIDRDPEEAPVPVAPPVELHDISDIKGAFVIDAAGARLGRVNRFYVASDGQAGDVVLKVNTREIAVPLTAFGFAYGGDYGRELRLTMERTALEDWIALRRTVPQSRR